MNVRIRTMILAAAGLATFAAPALADTVCTVNAPIRLRKSPSKSAKVVAVLKKDAQVTAVGACEGGWVKIASTDNHLSGYVGGWALTSGAPKAAAAAVAPAQAEVAKVEQATPVSAPMEVPSNEKLAMQITEMRLNVLAIERNMDKMDKEIQKIKVTINRKKGHKRQAKKG